MKKLLLYDTEDLTIQTVLDKVGKYSVFDAKHGRKFLYTLAGLLVSFVILSMVVACFFADYHYKKIDEITAEANAIETKIAKDELHYMIGYLYLQTDTVKPNEDTVYNFIKGCNSWFPEYIMAQAIIESGCGASELAKKTNNLFGMRCIDQSKPHRLTTQIQGVDCNGYGVYKNWQLSVVDRILWELSRYKSVKPSLEKYQNGFYSYAEAENYTTTVINLANKYKKKK